MPANRFGSLVKCLLFFDSGGSSSGFDGFGGAGDGGVSGVDWPATFAAGSPFTESFDGVVVTGSG